MKKQTLLFSFFMGMLTTLPAQSMITIADNDKFLSLPLHIQQKITHFLTSKDEWSLRKTNTILYHPVSLNFAYLNSWYKPYDEKSDFSQLLFIHNSLEQHQKNL